MLEATDKKALLNSILRSKEFTSSQVYQNLLAYLVEASINNTKPKEYQIATEVFHKSANFDPNDDTIVRVHIYNLRKKLDQYYSNEGKNELFRIEIPKGHYGINFINNCKSDPKTVKRHYYWLSAVILLGLSNLLFIYLYTSQKSSRGRLFDYSTDAIWSNFLSSPIPKQIVLGDHYFFVKDARIREKRTIMRRDDVNTTDDLDIYKSENIERQNYKPLNYPMFPKNSVWPFTELIKVFTASQVPFVINYASAVTALDIKNYNTLFVGSFHTLASFNQTFRKSAFSYHVYPNVLTYHDEAKDTTITMPEVGDPVYYHIDYGVVRKIPGPNNNIIFIFASFHETGTTGIVKYFLDATCLGELKNLFMQKYGRVPDYFEILFKASGYDRTVYKTEIIYLQEIDPGMTFW
jgi:hypothetical protein